MKYTPKYDHVNEKEKFTSLIYESLSYLHEFSDLPPPIKKKVSWKLCAAHYMAIQEGELGNIEEVRKFLNYAEGLKEEKGIEIIPLAENDFSMEKKMIERIVSDDHLIGYGYCEDKELFLKEKEKIFSSLETLSRLSPDIYKEIEVFIDSIYLIQETKDESRFMRSGTNFYMWGMMFIYIHHSHTIPYYMEILAHECAHTALNLLNATDEIVLNDATQNYDAPFRKDKRPMIGIFHAYFVLSRICYMFNSVAKVCSDDILEEVVERFEVAKTKLVATSEIIEKHANLTKAGLEIHKDIQGAWGLI